MAKPKTVKVELSLSGNKMSFKSPLNYSKDFPWPKETKYNINIYDKNNYVLFDNSFIIRDAYWDYGRGIIFGGVKGTLSMNIIVKKIPIDGINLKNENEFIKEIKNDFRNIHSEHVKNIPELKALPNQPWHNYEYIIEGDKHIAYILPLGEQHYLMVFFNFINNSEGKKNNWKQQAQATVDNIMSSFVVE